MSAPIKQGDALGEIIFTANGEEIGRVAILAGETVERINFFQILERMTARFVLI